MIEQQKHSSGCWVVRGVTCPVCGKKATNIYERAGRWKCKDCWDQNRTKKITEKYVESDRADGPRGEYYDWCRLHDDGTLELGEEQGNYAGGTIISATHHPGNNWGRGLPEGAKLKHDYWWYLVRELLLIKAKNPIYYERIRQMLDGNCINLKGLE